MGSFGTKVIAIILFGAMALFAQNISTGSTWNTAGNWSLNHVPTASEDVIIRSNMTMDVNSAALGNLTVDASYTLDVSGFTLDVVNATINGTIQDGTYASSRVFQVSGNLSVAGTLTYVSTIFDGSADQVISGSGTLTFYYIEFNNTGGAGIEVSNTSSTQDYYQLIVSGGVFEPSNNWTTADVDASSFTKINITGGTFTAQSSCKFTFSASHDGPPPPFTYSTITISNSTSTTTTFQDLEFSSSDANNTLQFSYGSGTNTVQVNGFLTFNGSAKGGIVTTNCSLAYGSSGGLKYAVSGTVDSDEWPTAGIPNVILQSGAVTIPTGTFEVDTKLTRVNGSVSVTGTLQFDSSNETTLEYAPSPAANVTVGGEWVTGSTTLPSNVTINNSGQTVTVSATARVIPKTLTLTAGTLAMGSNNLTILGSIASSDIAGSGAVTSSATIYMDDGTTATTHYDQTISGSVTLANLTVNKLQTNNDLTITGSPTISGTLTVTNGNVIVDPSGALTVTTLTLQNSSSYTTGGKSISGLTTLTASNSSTFQFNGSSIETTPLSTVSFGNVNMNNSAGLNINGTVTVNGTLTFSQDATVNTSASNTLIISTTGSISGDAAARYVKGPLRKEYSATDSFTFPVGSTARRSAVFNYTSGTFGGTSVIEMEHSTGSFTSGTNPTGISAIDQSSHYILKHSGTDPTSFTYSFTGTFENGNFSPETRNRVLVQDSSTPTWTIGTTTPGTDINTTDNTVLASGFNAFPSDTPFIVAFGSATASVAWDGGGSDNNWSTAANWVGDQVPQTSDMVVLDNSVVTSDYTVVYDASVTQTSFAGIQVSSNATYNIELTLDKVATVNLTATSDAIVVGATDKLIYSGTSVEMGGVAYDASLTTYSGEVEYQSGSSVYVDAYGNLTINGASGTSGSTGTVSVGGNLVKNSSTAFSSSRPFTLTGNYTNTLGNATYSGGLDVDGSTFTITSGAIYGTVTLSGSSAQTIGGTTASSHEIANLTVNNSNGVTLGKPILVSGTLTLTSGLVSTTSANLLSIGSAGSISGYGSSRYIDGPLEYNGTGTKFFPLGDQGEYRPVQVVNINGTNTAIQFEMVKGNPGGTAGTGLNNISQIRYWSGSLTGGSLTSCRVRLYWGANDNVDASPQNLGDLRVATSASQGGTYTSAGNAGTNGNNSSGDIISNSLSTMQYFTLGSATGDNSLPVELAAFTATADYGRVTLDWTTASELNNLGFNIYRRNLEDQDAWDMMNEEMIDGQGSTSQETNYIFVDSKVVSGETYVYKLESVSLDGFRVDEKMVEVTVLTPEEYVLYNNYPNPFNPSTTLRFLLPETQEISLVIYDARGRVVRELLNRVEMNTGEHQVTWNAVDHSGTRVSSGMYFYRFSAGKFNKMGKMILLK